MSANRSLGYSDEGCPVVNSLLVNRPTRPIRRRAMLARVMSLAIGGGFAMGFAASRLKASSPSVDLRPKPMPRLQPGIVVGQEQKFGYSDLVTLVLPRLASGDVDSLPQFARRYAKMFKLTILANIAKKPKGEGHVYLLDKIGIGLAMDLNGDLTIVTADTANQLGANLGMVDRGVLSGNEDSLSDVVQVARTDYLVIFDAKANILIDDKHEERIVRHFVWAAPHSGKLGILIWQLRDNGSASYAIDSAQMQLIPSGFKEDRRIHVSQGNFLSSKIPTPDRFALESIPQGTPVPFSDRMKQAAGLKFMTAQDLENLLAGTSESLSMLQVPTVAKKP